MFTKYGDALPFGHIVFDHRGQRSMWLRIRGQDDECARPVGTLCIDQARPSTTSSAARAADHSGGTLS